MRDALDNLFDSEVDNEQKKVWLRNILEDNANENESDVERKILFTLKDLLDIFWFDKSKDIILNIYKDKAERSIQSYLNYKEDEFELIKEKFIVQIADLAKFYYVNRKSHGVIQQSQGSRSQTMERGIPKDIRESLPLPRVRIVGGG